MTDSEDLDTLHAFQQRMNRMPARRAELIADCRAKGRSWPQIAEALEMTHPGAMKAAKVR